MPNANGWVPLVKEPKFGATVRAEGRFTQMRVLSLKKPSDPSAGQTVTQSVTRGQEEFAPYVNASGDDVAAILRTRQAPGNPRIRVQWAGPGDDPCAVGCFNVTMKARNAVWLAPKSTADPFAATTYLWENPDDGTMIPKGLDGWARRSAGLAGTGAQPRTKAWPRDTDGDTETWNCLAANARGQLIEPKKRNAFESDPSFWSYRSELSQRATVGSPTVRRWELAGWKDGNRDSGNYPDLPYAGSMVLFTGWEGGRGPYDCEPLMVPVGPAVETYSAYARYAFGVAG